MRAAKTLYAQTLMAAQIAVTGSKRASSPSLLALTFHSPIADTPERSELRRFVPNSPFVDLPRSSRSQASRVRTETVIAIDFSKKIVLIGNSSYAGEMKKSVFTTLNSICRRTA